jgi:hypothetical protein
MEPEHIKETASLNYCMRFSSFDCAIQPRFAAIKYPAARHFTGWEAAKELSPITPGELGAAAQLSVNVSQFRDVELRFAGMGHPSRTCC